MEEKRRKNSRSLWVLLVLAAVVAAAILLLPGCIRDKEQTEEETTLVAVGDTAPDFTVEMFDGGETTLSQLRGDVVLVTFFATWCPACIEELTHVPDELFSRFGDRTDFHFLPVSREETREEVAQFRLARGLDFAMGLDPDRTAYARYATQYIPRNFLIDRRGRIAMLTVGYDAGEFDTLIEKIDELLNQK